MSTPQKETLENKALIRQFIEEFWNKGNTAFADEVVADQFQRHELDSQDVLRGREAFKKRAAEIRAAFPDMRLSHHADVSDTQRVGFCWEFTGTHQGEFEGVAPTGNRVSIKGISICCVINGKILEEFVSRDTLGTMQQLGVIPA